MSGDQRDVAVRDVAVREAGIRLGQFLKLADLADSGAAAAQLIADGAVTVNGETDTRRGRQLADGDVVVSPRGGARVAVGA